MHLWRPAGRRGHPPLAGCPAAPTCTGLKGVQVGFRDGGMGWQRAEGSGLRASILPLGRSFHFPTVREFGLEIWVLGGLEFE